MSSPLKSEPNRDATASIRGYVYQIYQSALAWIRLKPGETLFLEGAEDFDVHSENGVVTTQVKNQLQKLTLNNKGVIEAINNFWLNSKKNPSRTVSMRFLSTAAAGKEKSNKHFSGSGLDYWQAVAMHKKAVKPLRDFLSQKSLHPELHDFLKNASDVDLNRQFISRITWDTGNRSLDELISELELEIVEFGITQNANTHASTRALHVVIGDVVNNLTRFRKAELTTVSFRETFERATAELVPTGLMQAMLRQSLQTASSQPQIVLDEFDEQPPLVRDSIGRTNVVANLCNVLNTHSALFLSGASGSGKTSLACLVANATRKSFRWLNFRNVDATSARRIVSNARLVLKQTGDSAHIVLDDFPFDKVDQFESQFLQLIRLIIESGGSIITTSYQACSDQLLEKLRLVNASNQQVGGFAIEDIEEMLRLLNCPPNTVKEHSKVIEIASNGGHPQLVHARIKHVKENGWRVPNLTQIFDSTIEADVRRDARQKLVHEIPSDDARTLLYRLTLAFGRFSRAHALSIASVDLAVKLPGEQFDILVGPWIERIAEDEFRVCPILSFQGKDNLYPEEVSRVHHKFAECAFDLQPMSPLDFETGITHALFAQAEKQLAMAAHFLLKEKFDVPTAKALRLFSMMKLEQGQRLAESNPDLDAMLRVGQFKIASVLKDDSCARQIIARAFESLERGSRDETKLMVLLSFLIDSNLPAPLDVALKAIAEIARIETRGSSVNLRQSLKDLGFPGMAGIQSLFYISIMRLASTQDLLLVLGALEQMESALASELASIFNDDETARLFLNNAWINESKNVNFDAAPLVSALERSRHFASLRNLPNLQRQSVLLQATLHAEYLDDVTSAKTLLHQLLEVNSSDAYAMLGEAKILFKSEDYLAASLKFDAVLRDVYVNTIDATFALRLLAICHGKLENWQLASKAFCDAATLAKAKVESKSLFRFSIGLLADSAFCDWKWGDRNATVSKLTAALEALEQIPQEEDLRSHHVHVFIRHLIAFIFAEKNSPPNNATRSQLAVGMCSNQEPNQAVRAISIHDIDTIWAMLMCLDERWQCNLALRANLSVRPGFLNPNLLTQQFLRLHEFEMLALGKHCNNAVGIIIRATESALFSSAQQSLDSTFWLANNQRITVLPHEHWASRENQVRLVHTLSAIGVVALSKSQPIPFSIWESDLKMHGALSTELSRFFCIVRNEVSPTGALEEQVAMSLVNLTRQLAAKDRFRCHFILFNLIDQDSEAAIISTNALEKIVCDSWRQAAMEQRFSLVSPNLNAPQISMACNDQTRTGIRKISSVLMVAAPATGLTLSDDALTALKRRAS
jgi:chromosomal replication initiation ATPase DnaA